jgi:hypothetical protein
MRTWLAFIFISAGSSLVLAGVASDAAQQLEQAYPDVQLLSEGPQLTRVWAAPFGFGLSAEQTGDSFVRTYSDLFAVAPDELLPGDSLTGAYTLPLMYDAETGTYQFTLLYYRQYKDGLPVFRSELRLLVRNEPAFPLVWAGSSLHDLGDFIVPADAAANVAEGAAHAAALASVPGLVNFSAADLVVWAGVDRVPATPAVALSFVADNGRPATGDYQQWLFVTDAGTGAVLYREDLILHTDVTGSVHGMSTTLPKSAECNPEVDWAMPYAKVAIGSTTVYADASGNFTIPNGGTAAVTVTSYMSGYRFNVSDQGGTLETLTLTVTPPGPANFVHNAANTSEFIRAEVNAYIQCNVVRDWVLTYAPAYPTISTQTGFQVNVNLNQTCNAYYDGTLNLYRAGGGCANTAYSNVIHHEYGHHIVTMGGSGQDAYGEGLGDTVAALIANDPILGYGFEGNCNAGIRTADNTYQYPCTGEIHDCGQLLSGCVWSTRNELSVTHPDTYLSIISNLTVNSVPLHDGGTITPSIYTDFVTLDGGPAGPHNAEITAGFAAHNMVPGAAGSDACAAAPAICPGTTYFGSTVGMTNDGSASCGSSSTSPDVWFKYTPAASGSAHLETCDSGYDTVLSVHTGCPGTSGNQVGCNDDTGWFGDCGLLPTNQSSLTVSVTGGATYYVRVSGASGATGEYALNFVSGPACAAADTAPPTPNPLTFAAPPAPLSASAISMTATTASDATPPVQYEFEFVAGGAGGTSSSWQSSTQYADSGLSPDTAYTYRVRARDSASPPNVGSFSGDATAATWANVPAAPTLTTPTAHTLTLSVNPNGNPSTTVFAVQCTASSPADAAWNGQYVNASGQPSAAAVWQTDAVWDYDVIQGLQSLTSYTFAVKARNQQGIETALGPGATLATLSTIKGDLNCDGTVSFGDINPFVLALTSPIEYGNMYPGCPILNGDINNDGTVNFGDINPFVALLTGP